MMHYALKPPRPRRLGPRVLILCTGGVRGAARRAARVRVGQTQRAYHDGGEQEATTVLGLAIDDRSRWEPY